MKNQTEPRPKILAKSQVTRLDAESSPKSKYGNFGSLLIFRLEKRSISVGGIVRKQTREAAISLPIVVGGPRESLSIIEEKKNLKGALRQLIDRADENIS